MNFYQKIFLFVLAFVFSVSSAWGGQSVTITKVEPTNNNGYYHLVTLDFGGEDDYDAHYNIGKKYAEEILDVYFTNEYEDSISTYFREVLTSLNLEGIYFDDLMDRVDDLMEKFDDENDEFYLIGAEIEGMVSVFNAWYNGYASKDRLWILMFPENQITLKELLLWNMLSDALMVSGCSTVSVWGDLTPDVDPELDGRTIVGRNLDFFPGITLDGHTGKITSMHALTYFVNQGSKKDFMIVSFLGSVTAQTQGFNVDGMYVSENLSLDKEREYGSENRYSINAVMRHALEAYSSVDSAAGYIANNKLYTHGSNITLADTEKAYIIETSCITEEINGKNVCTSPDNSIRKYDCDYDYTSQNCTLHSNVFINNENPPDLWYYEGEALVAVNSYQLYGKPNNHTDGEKQEEPQRQIQRLGNYYSMLNSMGADGEITMDEIKQMLSYGTDGESYGDIFRTDNGSHTTLNSSVFDTKQKILKIHFAPCPYLIERPDLPDYADINFGFLGQ